MGLMESVSAIEKYPEVSCGEPGFAYETAAMLERAGGILSNPHLSQGHLGFPRWTVKARPYDRHAHARRGLSVGAR